MIGAEAYLIIAAILTAIGFWRTRPGWFIISALLAILAIHASAFVLAGCVYTGTEWVCHYVSRPDILAGAVGIFFLDIAGFLLYGFEMLRITLEQFKQGIRRGE